MIDVFAIIVRWLMGRRSDAEVGVRASRPPVWTALERSSGILPLPGAAVCRVCGGPYRGVFPVGDDFGFGLLGSRPTVGWMTMWLDRPHHTWHGRLGGVFSRAGSLRHQGV